MDGVRGVDSPKISVIVPVYKVEPYLRKCLDSIVNQTYENLEIILVDDGSPDNCGAICDEYAARDKRITVIHKPHGGVSSARNAGLAAATGEWLGWVDSDDWIEPDMYEYLLHGARKYGADIAVCGRIEIYPNQKVPRGWEADTLLDRKQAMGLLLKNDLMQNYLWDKLWKRELFQGLAFPEGKTFEDVAVMYRIFERAERVVCVPGYGYNYRHHGGSIIANVSLENKMNYYLAAKARYEEMRARWPQFERQLLAQCAVSSIGIWCAYYDNPRETRQRMKGQLREISEFCAPHVKAAGEYIGVGLAGKLVLVLVPHARWWSFALARWVSKLYRWKHGRPL